LDENFSRLVTTFRFATLGYEPIASPLTRSVTGHFT